MSEGEFAHVLTAIKPYTDYVYFHLMGEPLCHPSLERFLEMAGDMGFKVIITTNGSLLARRGEVLLNAPALHKVNVSLHAFEANDLDMPFFEYLEGCFEFGKRAEGENIVVYRLWNSGGEDTFNGEITAGLEKYFPKPWVAERRGIRIGQKVFLEHGDRFDWPSLEKSDLGERMFCMGMRDQVGILADGTVVPCCLDSEGSIPLGNVFLEDFGKIISSERATAISDGFANSVAHEELCRRCGYAHAKFK